MQDIQITSLQDNTSIVAIGSFFRRLNKSKWGVNLEFLPSQDKRSLSVSQLPILVRKRILNPTKQVRNRGYKRSISIENTVDWQVCSNAACPIFGGKRLSYQDSRQLCFYFKSVDGLNVYLPQIEFARALFLHDAYLSRTALEPDALKIEFDIQLDKKEDKATINVSEVSGYAKTSLNSSANRRVLSWILIDPCARASFESIDRYQKKDGIEKNGYRQWDFQFDPPPLPKFKLVIKGQYDPSTNSFFVWEITSIANIIHRVPAKVEFHSRKFKEHVRGEEAGGRQRPLSECPDRQYLQDGEDANSNTSNALLHAPSIMVSFANPFVAAKIFSKKQTGLHGRKDEDQQNQAGQYVSTEEGSKGGVVAQADWDIPIDNSDDAHLYENKFKCFLLMLAKLETADKCKIISKTIQKLPKVDRCERHLLKKGEPRCLIVVVISCNGKKFILLEVDTSDAAKSLSTKLLSLKKPAKWNKQLAELKRKLLKGSLSWPSRYLDQICNTKSHVSISHPRTKNKNKGVLAFDSVGKWADQFHRWMLLP